MSSSESHATVTYTSISFDSNLPPRGFHLMDLDEFEAPEEASQSPEQAPPSPYYVPSLEHPPSLDYVLVLKYPKYLVPSDDEIPEDPEEDPEEDLADYLDEEEEEESSKDDDEEEEEHLASADSTLPAIYSVPSAEDLEPFETDESAATPPPPRLLSQRNIPEMDMSFWKSLCLTTIAFRFEVRESSTAAAARQTRPTLACRVDYEFIDTIDASIQASENRVMTAVEEVNERVIDFATTQRQDAHELQRLLMPDRHGPRSTALEASIRTLEAQVRILQTQHERMEWQRQQVGDMVTAQGVANALAEHEANRNSRNGNDSHYSRSNGRRQLPTTREGTYSDFLKCKPLNFKGTKGVVGLTYALTWWNSHVKTVGHDAVYGMPWKTLKKMMTKNDWLFDFN
ncbi:hypothetical protein Tco_0579611 [Tanacetum coccineum]